VEKADANRIGMREYARQSRKNDREGRGLDPNLVAQRAVQDVQREEKHRQWDLQAQDKTPKSARFHFAVVGEGSRTALENFLNGYEAIDWSS
jgi:hypothetical protein